MEKVIIIGAGPSGVMASLRLSEKYDVTILEANDKTLKKLLLTGNGKCNFFNSDININKYNTDSKDDLNEILSHSREVLKYLLSLGIYPKIKDNYYYPYSENASSIKKILDLNLENKNINVKLNEKVIEVSKNNDQFIVKTNDNSYECHKLIIACGSKAYPKTGSDGFSYDVAKSFNHHINPILPSLVPVLVSNPIAKEWDRIRVDGNVKLFINNNLIQEEIGQIQLTKNGLSGICIFNLSGKIAKALNKKEKVSVKVNFLSQVKDINNYLENSALRNPSYSILNLLETLIDYRLLIPILKQCHISINQKYINLTNKEKDLLIKSLTDMELEIIGTDDFNHSQVCTGGISLKEINPDNMESRLVDNLYFIGEGLDVDGICGGYNLAFAFITGYLVANN